MEVLVSLALFALIAAAGFTMLEGLLQTRARTEAEVERLADLQRTMVLLTRDFSLMEPGSAILSPTGVSFRRSAADDASPDLSVRYGVEGRSLTRTLGEGASSRTQALLSGVAGVRMSVFLTGQGWTDAWPTPEDARSAPPAALAIELVLTRDSGRPSGVLRRVIELPAAS